VCAVLRGAAGLSQLDFGHLLGWSQSIVTKVERRRRDTFHDIREILRVCDVLEMPRQALLPLILGRMGVTLESDGDVGFWGVNAVDLDRREFGMMATGLALSGLSNSFGVPLVPPPDRVDVGHVRFLRASLERLRTADRTVGGGSLRGQALRFYARARAMLDESEYTEQVGRELLVVTADLGIVAAWLAYDAGDQQLARSLYGEAELLAGSAGDNELMVHVYANLAQQATHVARVTGRRGTAREALRFADRAADAARHAPSPTLHALIALRLALAHAQLGDTVAFRAAIGRARRELDRGRHDSDRGWTAFISYSEITGYEAMGSIQLGHPEQASDLYRVVLDDTERSPRDRAYYRARLAAALTAAGDHRGGIEQGQKVLPGLGEKLTSTRVLEELRPVRQAAQAVTAEEEFCVRFDDAARMLAPA
jgi:transcriptional regulator with XRE-family HTH domain